MPLLGNQNKHLSQIIIKGVLKGNFSTVINWFKDLIANTTQILYFIERSEVEAPIFLKSILPGFSSKNEEVIKLTCQLIVKLAQETNSYLKLIYEWFCSKEGAFEPSINCLKKHPNLSSSISDLLFNLGMFDLLDLFKVRLRKITLDPKEYIIISKLFFDTLIENEEYKYEVNYL